MNVSLYQAAAALTGNARWQELISENLASSSIPGFKKNNLLFSAIEGGLMPTVGAATDALHFSLPSASSAIDFSMGEMRPTGVPTDVAIEGPGFFEVQLPNGSNAYTRDGEFHLNSEGQLVTKSGYLVIGEGGPIQVDRNNPAPLSIAPTGEVSQGTEVRGKLRVFSFDQPGQLSPIGGGYFAANSAGLIPTPLADPKLRQGTLERANISPVAEMAHLIAVMRMFEANQKIIQTQDERMGRVISELGNPS